MPRRANPPAIAKRLHYIIDSVTGSERRDDCYISTYLGHIENFAAVTRERAWTAAKVKEHVAIVYTWIKRREHHYLVDMEVAEKFAAALNSGSNEHSLLNLAWRLVNNSMMAGSKFLHFYMPDRFPITDSWLCDWVSGTPSQGYGLDFYREWLGGVHLVDEERAGSALEWACATFGYEVTRTRAIEAMAFYYVKSLSESDRHALWDFFSGTFPAKDEAA